MSLKPPFAGFGCRGQSSSLRTRRGFPCLVFLALSASSSGICPFTPFCEHPYMFRTPRCRSRGSKYRELLAVYFVRKRRQFRNVPCFPIGIICIPQIRQGVFKRASLENKSALVLANEIGYMLGSHKCCCLVLRARTRATLSDFECLYGNRNYCPWNLVGEQVALPRSHEFLHRKQPGFVPFCSSPGFVLACGCVSLKIKT